MEETFRFRNAAARYAQIGYHCDGDPGYFSDSTWLTRSAAGMGIESTSEVVIVPKLPILSMTASSSALDRVNTWRM